MDGLIDYLTELHGSAQEEVMLQGLLPQLEADLSEVAKIFDASFWPPEPLEGDIIELLTVVAWKARSSGCDTAEFEAVVRRFGLELDPTAALRA